MKGNRPRIGFGCCLSFSREVTEILEVDFEYMYMPRDPMSTSTFIVEGSEEMCKQVILSPAQTNLGRNLDGSEWNFCVE